MDERTTDDLLAQWAKDAQVRIPELERELESLHERISAVTQKLMTFKNVVAAASGHIADTQPSTEKQTAVTPRSEKPSGIEARIPRGQIGGHVKAVLRNRKDLTASELVRLIHDEFNFSYPRSTLYVHLHRGEKVGEYVTSDGKWNLRT